MAARWADQPPVRGAWLDACASCVSSVPPVSISRCRRTGNRIPQTSSTSGDRTSPAPPRIDPRCRGSAPLDMFTGHPTLNVSPVLSVRSTVRVRCCGPLAGLSCSNPVKFRLLYGSVGDCCARWAFPARPFARATHQTRNVYSGRSGVPAIPRCAHLGPPYFGDGPGSLGLPWSLPGHCVRRPSMTPPAPANGNMISSDHPVEESAVLPITATMDGWC